MNNENKINEIYKKYKENTVNYAFTVNSLLNELEEIKKYNSAKSQYLPLLYDLKIMDRFITNNICKFSIIKNCTSNFTKQELKILFLMDYYIGADNITDLLSKNLNISNKTVEKHISNIANKIINELNPNFNKELYKFMLNDTHLSEFYERLPLVDYEYTNGYNAKNPKSIIYKFLRKDHYLSFFIEFLQK